MRTAKFGKNLWGRDFVVGDLHGMYDLLMEKLNQVGFSPQTGDRLFCVGDLIDRGPKSLECLELTQWQDIHSVIGNHERLMFDALGATFENAQDDRAVLNWMQNGGNWFIHCDYERLLQSYTAAFSRMPHAIDIETGDPHIPRVGIVHSDVASGQWGTFDPIDDVWSRHRFPRGGGDPVQGIDAVITGHTIVKAPTLDANVLNIDTGAFLQGGRLSLFELNELLPAFYSASAREARGVVWAENVKPGS